MNATTIMEIFERGSTNVRWCEDVIEAANSSSGKNELFIAEFYNTISNAVFVLVALVRLKWIFAQNQKPSNFGATVLIECLILGIGFGSAIFHAHQSRFAQFSDELPMSVVVVVYNLKMKGIHPLTTDPKYSGYFYNISHAVVAALWAVYVYTAIYGLFEACFALQLILSLGISYDAGRRVNHPTKEWWKALVYLVVAKGIWDWERYRFRTDACLEPGTLLLHPLWHIGAALSHYTSMMNIAQVEKKVRAKEVGKKCI